MSIGTSQALIRSSFDELSDEIMGKHEGLVTAHREKVHRLKPDE